MEAYKQERYARELPVCRLGNFEFSRILLSSFDFFVWENQELPMSLEETVRYIRQIQAKIQTLKRQVFPRL